ncbi:hypothetical protein MCJ35_17160 [Enterocloster sp. OA13]|uniref:hypothetical protein n=1 Tax=Enterocloster sp. OA13 TaxID=2914161 RepID=UPI0004700E03|nr:hypothetical protein [Enterocloster sp. OA13]
MEIDKIMSEIDCKIIDEDDGFRIYKVGGRKHLLYLECKDGSFIMERDIFEYLDGNKLPYSVLLYNISKEQLYYIDLPKENNWVKSCFMTCDKEKIFLGKQVLNSRIDIKELVAKIKKI